MPRNPKDYSKIRRESAWQRRRRLRIPSGHCTWCQKPVTKPAKHWCRDEACLNAFKMANDPTFIRQKVFERDAGICASCGNHPLEAERLWYHFREMASVLHQLRPYPRSFLSGLKCNCLWCFATRAAADMRKWEADHVLPVVEGGGQCGLENYRTLCLICHKRETKLLAARRAAARKSKKSRP